MENRKKDGLSKVFILTSVITFGLAIYFSYINNAQSLSLKHMNDELFEAKESLKLKNDQLESARAQALMWQDSLQNAIETVPTSSIPESVRALMKLADNSKYTVTIHSLKPDSTINRSMMVSLISNGYTVIEGTKYDEKPNWMNNISTVLYYTDETKKIAKEIAETLTESSGLEFTVKRGAGLGVKRGYEKKTFFVHYVSQSETIKISRESLKKHR